MSNHTPGPWRVEGDQVLADWPGTPEEAVICEPSADTPEEAGANARLIAAAPDMYALIETFGDRVTDMFEQMLLGNWCDDHGHDVRINTKMIALKQAVKDAIELRARISAVNAAAGLCGSVISED